MRNTIKTIDKLPWNQVLNDFLRQFGHNTVQGRAFHRHPAVMGRFKTGRKKGRSGIELPDPPDIDDAMVALAEITLKPLEIVLHQVKSEPGEAGGFIDHRGYPAILKNF
ncbi:MAG: hypothetical protein DYH13_02180 [Alphaproteobacteria bacterium PRO2]|nr:hypothetical protein [Alphaproteobacteria bacterium PRO2]